MWVTGMRKLILARHSVPDVDPSVPANQWHLSELGRGRAERLAEMLGKYHPSALLVSPERKAAETGKIVAGTLGLTAQSVDGLREHDRRNEPFFRSSRDFERKIELLFDNPNGLVFGSETG